MSVCARERASRSAPGWGCVCGASPSAPPLPRQDVESAMRLPLAFAVLLLASAQALAQEMGASDDLSYWSDWSDGDQVKVSPGGRCSARGCGGCGAGCGGRCPRGPRAEPRRCRPQEELPLPLEHFLQRMARRPRPQQFFGLMGKRDAGERAGGAPSLHDASSPRAAPNFTAAVARFQRIKPFPKIAT